jgi:hypothetical protein
MWQRLTALLTALLTELVSFQVGWLPYALRRPTAS